ncbi:hypothetical protein, partial [Mycobacterium tuberculosis]|uniref:hypothetical protein n=1 Tax=Mycobacterium tuberculosis TaxID=1773 RepID=UPI00054CAE79
MGAERELRATVCRAESRPGCTLAGLGLAVIHISEPTGSLSISYAFCGLETKKYRDDEVMTCE